MENLYFMWTSFIGTGVYHLDSKNQWYIPAECTNKQKKKRSSIVSRAYVTRVSRDETRKLNGLWIYNTKI